MGVRINIFYGLGNVGTLLIIKITQFDYHIKLFLNGGHISCDLKQLLRLRKKGSFVTSSVLAFISESF